MTEPESRYFESARMRIHYVVWGEEANPPIILVHGGRDHARSWDFVAQRLTDRYAVYAMDLRGHGDSDWSKGHAYQLSHHVADLEKLVEVLGRERVSLIGHSLGGRVIVDYACAFPEHIEKLVSIEGFGRPQPFDLKPSLRLRRFVEQLRETESHVPHVYPTLEAAEARMSEANQRLTAQMVKHLTLHAVKPVQGGYIWKFDYYNRVVPTPDWSMESFKAMWADLQAPILPIAGSDSWFGKDRRSFVQGPTPLSFVESTLGVKHVLVENAGHWVHHDQLDEFMRLARDFLKL